MYLQIRKRKLKRKPGITLELVLLESVWKRGKTTKEFIAYLASIREHDIQHIRSRILFWNRAVQILESINLPSEIRQKIEEKLSQLIPQPTDKENDWYQERLAQINACYEKEIDKPRRKKAKTGQLVITRRY